MAKAPVFLLICVDLRAVASADKDLDRVGVISGASIYPFAHNILLTARDRGWGGAMTTLVASAEPQIHAMLGMPSYVAVAGLIPLGRPRKVLTKLTRNPVSSFAHVGRWDGPALG